MIITVKVRPDAADAIARVARHYLQAIVGQAVILRGHRSPEALDAIKDYWGAKTRLSRP